MKVGTEKFGGIRSIFPAHRDFTASDSFAAKMVSDFRNRGFNGLGCVPSSELGSIEAHAVGRNMAERGTANDRIRPAVGPLLFRHSGNTSCDLAIVCPPDTINIAKTSCVG